MIIGERSFSSVGLKCFVCVLGVDMTIPESVQKMIDNVAYEYDGKRSFGSSHINAFQAGAAFSYELGFNQGIEAVCEWLNTFGYTEDHMSNIADSIQHHFKDQLRKTE